MKLEIGHFSVKDVRFGEKNAFADGILTVNREEAIEALNKDGKLKNVSLHIARPGDSTRIIPVKAAAGVRCRPDGRCVFPGYTGEVAQAGSGVTYALDGMCVLGAGLHSRQGMNGMVDMSGPAAEMSPYAKLINLVFVAENADPKEDVPFICAMSSGVTSLLLSVPVTGIISEKGVLTAELVMGGLFALLGLVVLLFLRESPEALQLAPYGAWEHSVQKEKKKLPPVGKQVVLLLGIAMVCAGFFTYCSWDNFNLSAIAAGYDVVFVSSVMALNGLMNMVGKPLYGVAADAMGMEKANLLYYGLLILGHVGVVCFNGISPLPVYAVAICLGLGCFTISTVGTPMWVAELTDEAQYASTLKKLQSCCTLGGLCMSPLPGLLADATGSYTGYYLFCAAATLLSLLLVNGVYKKQRRLLHDQGPSAAK
jgi:predicted MFS family arabinose efflux permease